MRKIINILIFVYIAVIMTGCSFEQKEWFIVEKAALTDAIFHKTLKRSIQQQKVDVDDEFVITGHRISKGDGVVIAYRVFNSGITDQAQYQKMTIYLPFSTLIPNEEINFTEEDVIGFWSNGSSNFPGKSGCFGYASKGKLRIQSVNDKQITVRIDIVFNLVSPGGWEKECGDFQLSEDVVLNKRKLESLTPWDGSIGKYIYDESIKN